MLYHHDYEEKQEDVCQVGKGLHDDVQHHSHTLHGGEAAETADHAQHPGTQHNALTVTNNTLEHNTMHLQ